jgi:hypothetical protein
LWKLFYLRCHWGSDSNGEVDKGEGRIGKGICRKMPQRVLTYDEG